VSRSSGLDLAAVRERLDLHAARVIDGDDLAEAAVAVLLRGGSDGVEALFIRRAEHPQDPWSGHMAFPGGRRESEDRDARSAAERETLEEVGVDLHGSATYLGRLDDLQAMARGRHVGMVVTPYVYLLTEDVRLAPNEEVQEAVWIPLDPLARGEHDAEIPWKYGPEGVMLPCYQVGGRTIWGLTWRMLSNFFGVTAVRGPSSPQRR